MNTTAPAHSVDVDVRKIVTTVEDIVHEGGPAAEVPLRRGSIAAVIANPFAGAYIEDIAGFMDALKPLGRQLARQLLDAMGVSHTEIEGYGKAAIVGGDGELEHGALWHVPGGFALRDVLNPEVNGASTTLERENALAIVPSTKKVGPIGAALDVPLTHINASYVRSHFDSMEVRVADAPRRNELVVILVMSTGSRVHARVGGLAAEDIAVWDGLR